MILLSKIKENLLSVVTLILLTIILLQRCEGGKDIEAPKIVRDTVWMSHDTMVVTKPQIIKTIPIDVSRDTIINHYIPDTNYQKLVLQYQDVVNQLLTKNIQIDSLKIDNIGWVRVLDTVQKNLVVGRSFNYTLAYPIIKETITLPPARKNQLYVGGEVVGSLTNLVSGINAGLLFKNKKDQIFGLKAGLTAEGQPNVGVSSFWKITFKK